MPDLNLRGVDAGLVAELKSAAALAQMTLKNFCVMILRSAKSHEVDSEKISLVPIAVPEEVWAAHKYLQERMDEAMGATGVSPEGLAALDKAKLYVSSDALARVEASMASRNTKAGGLNARTQKEEVDGGREAIGASRGLGARSEVRGASLSSKSGEGASAETGDRFGGGSPEGNSETSEVRKCTSCEADLRFHKGKWACRDAACAKYGEEQKVK